MCLLKNLTGYTDDGGYKNRNAYILIVIKSKAMQKRITENNRNICFTRISSPTNGAKINFEMYNYVMDVLLHIAIECLCGKTYPIYTYIYIYMPILGLFYSLLNT
jgi:hypothetical protein